MTRFLSATLLCAAMCSAPASAGAYDRHHAPDYVGSLHQIAMGPSRGPLCAPDAPQAQNSAESILQIMCLAALSDGEIAFSETREIALAKRTTLLALKNAAFEPTGSLEKNAKTFDAEASITALRCSFAVVAAENGINQHEQAFLDHLQVSLNISDETMSDVMLQATTTLMRP